MDSWQCCPKCGPGKFKADMKKRLPDPWILCTLIMETIMDACDHGLDLNPIRSSGLQYRLRPLSLWVLNDRAGSHRKYDMMEP